MHPPPATTQDVIRNGLEWGYYDGHQSDESNFKMMSETPFDTSKTASLTKRSSSSSNYSDDETLAIMESLPYMEAEPEKRHDDYSVAESDEEDMALLADALSAEIAQPIPPTSVINEMERPSSTDVFDPNLQRSSPTSNEHGKSDGKRNPSDEEELLDYDVEWDNVLECLPSLPRDPSLPKRPDIVHQEKETSTNAELQPYNTNLHATSSSHGGKPQPFSRPPFPNPVRNKSPVAGVSNSHVLRTCFRIGQMVNESSRCLKAGVEPTFELYARVTYSSRELLSRVQHFQFMDLFKEQLPYPTGMLSGWRTGSLLDRESAVFLEASDGGSDGAEAMVRMCRCIGKLRPDNKMQMGWIVVVLRIQEVGWDEIGGIKRTVCRE
ncbi:hypothetical protein B0T17DRAFT_524551 [Bombardia bombarda]|uniref:Uncharacterized protein n=1 Tax=Bombardia bombarda TaxID=252184 RepID=A0AA39X842_9PEZI|nr:hypothetical protein B0T17DRAFT_524551 [Bombardia bombarda]